MHFSCSVQRREDPFLPSDVFNPSDINQSPSNRVRKNLKLLSREEKEPLGGGILVSRAGTCSIDASSTDHRNVTVLTVSKLEILHMDCKLILSYSPKNPVNNRHSVAVGPSPSNPAGDSG